MKRFHNEYVHTSEKDLYKAKAEYYGNKLSLLCRCLQML